MKYLYFFCLLLFFASCENEERKLLLKTQNEYILELEEKKELILTELLQKKYDEELRIDSIELFEYFLSSYKLLDKEITDTNLNSYLYYKSLLFPEVNEHKKLNFNTEIPSLTDTIKLNHFKINILSNFIICNKYLLVKHTFLNCGISKNFNVSASFNLTKIDCKRSFLENGQIFLTAGYKKIRFNKIFFGKLDSSFYTKEKLSEFNTKPQYWQNESDLKLEILEEFKVDYYNGEDYFPLSKLKKNYENKIEGLMRTDSPFGGYEYIPFRYTFNE